MDGIYVVDKPAGVSSAQALRPVKERLARKTKVGHAGTLDPFATGVLLVLTGDATRLSRFAMALPKRYLATVRFGVATDTLDPEGSVVAEADPGAERPEGLDAAVAGFVGEIVQEPPAFSALKVGGRPAYALARSGKTPVLQARPVVVHSIEITGGEWPEVELEVRCGQGTYVRSLARDLGVALGLPAHLAVLRRTHIGPFTPRAEPVSMLDLTDAAGLPRLTVTRADALAFARGGTIAGEGGEVAVVCGERLVGIGVGEGSRIRPETVLAGARRWLEGEP